MSLRKPLEPLTQNHQVIHNFCVIVPQQLLQKFQCPVEGCSKEYSREINLKHHLRQMHKIENATKKKEDLCVIFVIHNIIMQLLLHNILKNVIMLK